MTFICQAASYVASSGTRAQNPRICYLVIKNELGKQFFQKCLYFDKEGRWENKIKNVPFYYRRGLRKKEQCQCNVPLYTLYFLGGRP